MCMCYVLCIIVSLQVIRDPNKVSTEDFKRIGVRGGMSHVTALRFHLLIDPSEQMPYFHVHAKVVNILLHLSKLLFVKLVIVL